MRRRLPGGRPATPHSVPALITALAGLAIALTWWRHPAGDLVGAVGWFPALGLTVALAAAGYFHVEYRHGADEDVNAIDLFEAALAPALLLLPGPGLLIAVVAARLASETLLRVRPLKIAFNVAAWAAAAALGSAVLDLLGDGRRGATGDPDELVALAAAMAVATLVNQLAFVTVLRLAGRRTFAGVLAELGPAILPAWIVGGGVILTFGLLFAAACSWVPVLAWLLPAPLAALYWASQGYAASRAALARTSLLHRASRDLATSAAGPEQIRTFLEGVRHAFEASAVHLVTAVDGALHVQGSPRAAADRGDDLVDPDLAAALAALPGPQRVTVLSPDEAIASGLRRHGWRDGLAVPVRAPERTEAVLCVFDPKGVVTSEDSELAVVEGLTAELGGVLARAEVEAGLRRSEARFRTLVQEASDVVVVIDAAWVVSDVLPSPVPSPILSEPGEEITDGAHPDDVDGMISCLSHLADRPGATGSFTWRAPGREGSWRHLETMATNLLDDPAVGGIVLISRDVTERVLATELAAGQAEALGRISRRRPLTETVASLARAMEAQAPAARLTVALFVEAPEPVVEHGASLPAPLIQGLSASLASERPAGEGRARPTMVVADVDADERWAALAPGGEVRSVWAAPITRSEGSDAIGVAIVHFDHPCTPGEADLRVLHSVADLVHIAVEAVRAEARLVHQASHDPLTGLPNRVLFLDRTAVAISRLARSTRTVAVLFVDLDRFKTVNDSLGHEVGDRLLIELARRLEGAMRPSDTVARFGGDEFTILCDDIPDPHEAVVIAARVREALATPVHLEGHDLYVTASVGIAHTSDRSRPPHELVEEADAAMYEAKAAGGDVHRVYDEAVRSRAMLDLVTYQALREAISGDELRLHYQPVVDLVTGRIVGAEALVRWDHSRLGLLGPDQFIPFAEATGLIVPIGALVLAEACAQRQRWAGRADSAFAVWVNLSARQFADPDLVTTITTALEESGASPSALVLEITESALMEHAEATLVTLRTLHDLGVRIVIDDFGTGYSSLSYLKRFPVDALKIDKSFVAGLGADRDDEAIVGSVINLAHNLGMTAVAEGVETDAQLELLRGLHCDVVQGFRFSRPVPADEISFERPLDRPRQGLLDLREPVHRRA